MDVPPHVEFTDLEESEFDKAFELLSELVDLSQTDEMAPRRKNAVFTSCVVIWMRFISGSSPTHLLRSQ